MVLSYNKAWIIGWFFASLEAQTRRPDRIVIVDDASTDWTQEILQTQLARYLAIRLPMNRGQSHCRNIGVRSLNTDYIVFLDGDVEMAPHMLQAMEQALDADPGVSIAYCHYDRVGSRIDPVRGLPWDPMKLLEGNYISMVSMVRAKDLPDPPLDEGLRRYEDWDLWLRMMKAGKRGVLVPEVLFKAHYQSSDLSGSGESIDWRVVVERKHGIVRGPMLRPLG